MDNIYRSLIVISILFFPDISIADSYPFVYQYTFTYTSWQDITYSNSTSGLAAKVVIAGNTIAAGSGYPTASIVRTETSGSHNSYTISVGSGRSSICPAGGTLSGANCINASSCLTGQIRDSITAVCTYPPLTCPIGQYDGGLGSCLPVPNCNTATTGNFFDVVSKSCVPEECAAGGTCTVYACLDNTKFYCPPTSSCQVAGSLCSNNPPDKAVTDAAKAAAQAAADKAAKDAQYAADQAAVAEAAKLAELQAVSNAESAARIAANDLSLTEEQRAQANLDFAASAAYQAQKQAEYDNAKAAAAAAKTAAASATVDNTAAQTTSSYDSDSLSKRISDWLNQSNIALNDAVTGDGNGTGAGTGDRIGLPSPYDKLGDSIKGVEDAVKNKKTDCELDPSKVGCATIGETGTSESIAPDEIGFSTSHGSWGAGSCPSSVSLGHGVTFDYLPMCNSLDFFKPILISVGLLMSLFIVSGGVKD